MKSYHIHRAGEHERELGEVTVEVKDGNKLLYRLSPERSLKVADHSPTGFEFGYGGSGPTQLALAILLDFTSDEQAAQSLSWQFKQDFIAGMGHPGGVITGEQIRGFLKEYSAYVR